MSKKSKKSRTQLIIVFIILLVAVVIVQIRNNQQGERSFDADLMKFTPADIEHITISAPDTEEGTYHIARTEDNWTVSVEDKTYDADNEMIDNMMNELSELTAIQKVAASKDKWNEYDVTDTTGVRVVVQGAKKELGDIYIGRFSYNQTTRKPKTFVRLNKAKDVFAVEGYISMTFNRGLDGLRNKSIFRGNRNNITRIAFTYPADSSFTLSKDSLGWTLNGQPADSTQMSNYLGTISYLTGTEFRDDIEPTSLSDASFRVVIEGNNMASTEIKAIRNEEGNSSIVSSANPTTVFDGDSGNLFPKLFVGENHFK